MTRFGPFPLILLTVFLLTGCAGSARQTAFLLEQDYTVMGDEELLHYYDELGEQIIRQERAAVGTGVGIGYGRSPFHIGVGTGVTRRPFAEELRERRIEVRMELRRRGLASSTLP
jgi:hypothetical protein